MVPHRIGNMLIQYQRDLSTKAESLPLTRITVQDRVECKETLQTYNSFRSCPENVYLELTYRICQRGAPIMLISYGG